MKRILTILALFAPAVGLIFFALQPKADLVVSVPIFHFYIVTFITFSAAVISILLAASLGAEAKPRHVLAAAAFAVIGSVFFSHGLATPNALIDHFHPAVEWSAWLTLFGSGALSAAAGFDGPQGPPKWLPVRRVIYAAAAGVLLYSAIAAFAPGWLSGVDEVFNALAAPWHRYAIFALTLVMWLLATFRLWRTWRVTRNRIDGVLAFVALWLATATVSMHMFTIWKLSWWLYHVVLLVAFLVTVSVLVAEYEQIRQFRLVRYYLAASLILTALLALAASAIFTQFAYNTLVEEAMTSATNVANNLANTLASDMPDLVTADDVSRLNERPGVRALFDLRLIGLSINSVSVYDQAGVAAHTTEPEWVGVKVENRAAFESALGGQTAVVIRQPDDAPATYRPAASVHIVEAYAPIRPGGNTSGQPIGVLVTIQEAPTLNKAVISARIRGLVTAAITMGLLFVALLSVVGRADRDRGDHDGFALCRFAFGRGARRPHHHRTHRRPAESDGAAQDLLRMVAGARPAGAGIERPERPQPQPARADGPVHGYPRLHALERVTLARGSGRHAQSLLRHRGSRRDQTWRHQGQVFGGRGDGGLPRRRAGGGSRAGVARLHG